MYGYECWTIKKTEYQRIYAFELLCWRRLFRVPWTARRSNQSILKEINPDYSLEGLMLKLKLQNFGHLIRRAGSLEKDPMLGKTEGRRRKGWQRTKMVGWHNWLNGHEFEQVPGMVDREAWRAVVHKVAKSQTWWSNWSSNNLCENCVLTWSILLLPSLRLPTSSRDEPNCKFTF